MAYERRRGGCDDSGEGCGKEWVRDVGGVDVAAPVGVVIRILQAQDVGAGERRGEDAGGW